MFNKDPVSSFDISEVGHPYSNFGDFRSPSGYSDVGDSLCWRLFSLCWRFSKCIKLVRNIPNLSSTHLVSIIHVTNLYWAGNSGDGAKDEVSE